MLPLPPPPPPPPPPPAAPHDEPTPQGWAGVEASARPQADDEADDDQAALASDADASDNEDPARECPSRRRG